MRVPDRKAILLGDITVHPAGGTFAPVFSRSGAGDLTISQGALSRRPAGQA